MIVVEPSVTADKLRLLLDESAESEHLAYKSTVDLRQTHDLVELAKDIGAMQSSGGGFIVFGADSNGSPTDALPDDQVSLFDEATLRAKLAKWIPDPYQMLVACHRLDGHLHALIYMAQRADGFCVFRQDGTYEDPPGRSHTAFRAGDVFVRHGSASERWNQSDVARIRQSVRDSEKESWQAELAPFLAQIQAGSNAQAIARGPISALTWRLDATSFRDVYLEQIRAHDVIPLGLMLEALRTDARALLDAASPEIATLLDRLASFIADMLALREGEWFTRGVETAVQIYDAADHFHDTARREAVWLEIIDRVVAIGGLAVRLNDWASVRFLIAQKGTFDDFRHYNNWVRHALTMAARSKLCESTDGDRKVEQSLLQLAHRDAMRLPALNRGDDEDTVLNSLCQFDFLGCLVAVDMSSPTYGSPYYTSFARFYSNRTEPIVRRLLDDPTMRAALFHGTDAELASALAEINKLANQESFRYAGWDGYQDPRIREFIQAALPAR